MEENTPMTPFGQALAATRQMGAVGSGIQPANILTGSNASFGSNTGGPRPFPTIVNPQLATAASAPSLSFGTENYARQEAYGAEKFSDLGFNILRDQTEDFYNANTSTWDDLGRASRYWMPGFKSGFASNYNGFVSLFEGNSANAAALARMKGREAEESAGLAMSTRGGFGQSATNIFYNLNYTAGIAAELALEELAFLAAAPETGGTSLIPAVGRGAVGVGKIAKSLFNLTKNAATLRRAETLKSVYDLGRTSKAFATGAAQSFYRGTLPGVAGIGQQIQAGRTLGQIATNSKTYLDLYRNVRLGTLAIDESALEAAGSYNGIYDSLYQDFVQQNGRIPTAEEQAGFVDQAEKGAMANYWPNLAVIYLTNGITFGNLSSSRSLAKSFETITKNAAGRTIAYQEAGKVVGKFVEKGWKANLSAAKQVGFKRLAGKTFQKAGSYFAANWAEGAQEIFQEGLAQSVDDYYVKNYLDPSYVGLAAALNSAKKGALSQISQNGLEAFLGGFLGGGIVSSVGTGIRTVSKNVYSQFTPEKYEQKLAEDAADSKALADWITEVGQDPMKLFAPELENLQQQASANESFSISAALDDGKAFEDIKDRSAFNHVRKLYLTGSIPAFKAAILDHKTLTPEEKMELFNVSTVEEADNIIDTIATRTDRIQKSFEYAFDKYQNPYVLADYKRGTDEYKEAVVKHVGWNRAVEDFVFGLSSFERTAERLGEIYNAAKADPVLAGMSNSDFSVLFNYGGNEASTTAAFDITLEKEVSATLEEVDRLKRTARQQEEQAQDAEKQDAVRLNKQAEENKKKATELEQKANLLADYQSKLESYLNNNDGEKEGELFTEIRENLFDSITNYLEYLAKNSRQPLDKTKVKDLVEKIRDYYAVGQDNIRFRNAVNTLSDPTNLNKLADHHRNAMQKVYDYFMLNTDLVKAMLINQKEKNRLISELQELGVLMSPEALGKFITDNVLPSEFYSEKDSDANGVLIMDSELGQKVQDILKVYEFVQEEAQAEEAPAAKETTASDIEAKKADIERRRQEEIANIKINTSDFQIKKHRAIAPDVVITSSQAKAVIKGALNGDYSKKRINQYEELIKKSNNSNKQKILILTEVEKIKIDIKYDAELAALEQSVQQATQPSDARADIERRRQEEILNRKGNTISESEVKRRFIEKRNSDSVQTKLTEALNYTNGNVNSEKRWIDKEDAIFEELIAIGVRPDNRGVIDNTAINKAFSENESKIRKEVNDEIKQEGLKRVTDEFRKQDDTVKFKEINAKYDAELAALGSSAKSQEAPAPVEAPVVNEQAATTTAEERAERQKEQKKEEKKSKKAKYQINDIKQRFPSTYNEIVTLAEASNAERKAEGLEPLNLQSFLNVNAKAQDLVEKAIADKEKRKNKAAESKVNKFKSKLEKAKTLEEFEDIDNLDGGELTQEEYNSVNVPALKNKLMQKLGETTVDVTEISEENRKQMEDVQAAADKQAAANAKRLSEILEEENSEVTAEDLDNIFC
jgi:hypothetical protein